MNRILTILFVLIACNSLFGQKEDSQDYVQFDDRKNVVHGVYLGFNLHYGQIDGRDTGFGNFKLAYVANRKIEIGFGGTVFFNERDNDRPDLFNGDKIAMIGAYGGLHVEPILFGKRFISVSFPVLVGGGAVGYFGNNFTNDYEGIDDDIKDEDLDTFFIVEPGINILYNFSRYTQLETGFRYRFTSDYEQPLYKKGNINGFSVGIGLKVGIFNMGRKKKVKDNF
ncbi:MAG: hypothetical protein ACON5F_08990 [Jejuia sp.]